MTAKKTTNKGPALESDVIHKKNEEDFEALRKRIRESQISVIIDPSIPTPEQRAEWRLREKLEHAFDMVANWQDEMNTAKTCLKYWKDKVKQLGIEIGNRYDTELQTCPKCGKESVKVNVVNAGDQVGDIVTVNCRACGFADVS